MASKRKGIVLQIEGDEGVFEGVLGFLSSWEIFLV